MTLLSEQAPAATPVDPSATITGLLRRRVAQTPQAVARWSLDAGGQWQPQTWADVGRQVAVLARGLHGCGVAVGGHVGLMAATSADWDDCSMAILANRGVVVGLDVHATADQLDGLLQHVPLHGLVVEHAALLQRLPEHRRAALAWVLVLREGSQGLTTDALAPSGPHGPQVLLTLASVRKAGEGADATAWDQALASDTATIVFTSGTTGVSKAIAYRHEQVCTAVHAILSAFHDIAEGSRLACWLPLSNLFQRIINLSAIERGAQTYYVPDPRQVVQHLPAIRPHLFIGVPRFFEKLHQEVARQLAQGGRGRQAVAAWALAVGQRWAEGQRAGRPPGAALRWQHRVADALVLRRVRAVLGGELRYLVSGSAPMPVDLLAAFHGLGLPVLEAYGLSECIIPLAANRADAWRLGTVGQPLAGIELRVADDGELQLRSAGVYSAYLGQGAQTRPVDAEGYLATGDLGDIDAQGFVRLTGRKSEVFKTSTGRQVAPATIEAALRAAPWVDHAAVFGAGQPWLVAVLSLDPAAPAVLDHEALRGALREALAGLPSYLRPVGAVLTRRAFSMDSGELTANLKLRRHAVAQRHSAALQRLSQALAQPVPSGWSQRLDTAQDAVELVRL